MEFENLPNFRQAGGSSLTTKNGRVLKDGMIFRSSRTDFVTQKDVGVFQELGIRSIIDLRDKTEYKRANGDKLLDRLYTPYTIKNGERRKLRYRGKGAKVADEDSAYGRRYLISMTSMKLIWHLFRKLNFFLRWCSLLLALFDWLFRTHFFVKFYNHMVLNNQSMSERYIEVLEFNKDAVRYCFEVLCNKENLPALIHCAHGKDRTGLIVALILSTVGVNDEDILTDYGLSESGLLCIKQRVYEEVVVRYGFSERFLSAKPQVMRTVLCDIRSRYGSVEDYLLSAGVSNEQLKKLKDLLL